MGWSATDLREALAQALWVTDQGPRFADEWWDLGSYDQHRMACYGRADTILATLADRREQVLAWLGMEQVAVECSVHGVQFVTEPPYCDGFEVGNPPCFAEVVGVYRALSMEADEYDG